MICMDSTVASIYIDDLSLHMAIYFPRHKLATQRGVRVYQEMIIISSL